MLHKAVSSMNKVPLEGGGEGWGGGGEGVMMNVPLLSRCLAAVCSALCLSWCVCFGMC